jgi:hypothetical protein
VSNVEVNVNAPDGPTLDTGGRTGTAVTGNWVNDGMVFYLQDVTNGKPATLANTLDTVTVRLVPAGNLFFGGGPLYIPPGQTMGSEMLIWNAPTASNVQLWEGSSTGVQVTGDLPPSGSAIVGPWVTQSSVFYLQSSQNGSASGVGNTLATFQAGSGSPANTQPPPTTTTGTITFSASPNPIPLAPSRTSGMTTLTWNAPGHSQLVILVNSANGTPMTGTLPSQGTANTGDWVTDGMQFFLQDASSGTFTGSANTLAFVTVHVQLSSMSVTVETPEISTHPSSWKWMQTGNAAYFELEIDRWMGSRWCSESADCRVETRSGAVTELEKSENTFRWRVRAVSDKSERSLWSSWIYSDQKGTRSTPGFNTAGQPRQPKL